MSEEDKPWATVERGEIDFVIRYRHVHAALEFEAHSIAGRGQRGEVLFVNPAAESLAPNYWTDDIGKAERFAHGSVRFDGCCNVMFDDCADNCMLHGCGREDMTRIGALFDVLYDLALEAMPQHEDYLRRRE